MRGRIARIPRVLMASTRRRRSKQMVNIRHSRDKPESVPPVLVIEPDPDMRELERRPDALVCGSPHFPDEQSMTITRDERQGDRERIRAVNLAAFETTTEADLVDAVRQRATPLISLVAEDDQNTSGISCSLQ